MKKINEFKTEATKLLLDKILTSTNVLMGLSKTSSALMELLMAMPLEVEARHISNMPKPGKRLNQLGEFTKTYLRHDDQSQVVVAFFYSKERDLKKIIRRIDKYGMFFAAEFLREVLKCTMLVNTKSYYGMMSAMISQTRPDISRNFHYHFINKAGNYVANSFIAKLFKSSSFAKDVNKVLQGQDYRPIYSSLTDKEILITLIDKFHELDLDEFDLSDGFSFSEEFGISSESGIDDTLNIDEGIITDIGETAEKILASASRGTTSASIFGELLAKKKVKTGWFKKLSRRLSKDVYYATSCFDSNWSGFNNVYRDVFKAPRHKFYDNKISLVLSIDQSGSVSTDALGQLFYLISKTGSSISKLLVLVHDTDIVKEFVLESDYDISTDIDFIEALGTRNCLGGTSHRKVFEKICKLIETSAIDPNETIYISFSDNYSDISDAWDTNPIMKEVFSTIFLATEHRPMNIPNTSDISIC